MTSDVDLISRLCIITLVDILEWVSSNQITENGRMCYPGNTRRYPGNMRRYLGNMRRYLGNTRRCQGNTRHFPGNMIMSYSFQK